MAFTEEGVAMLSSVLNSRCAFVRLRQMAGSHKDLLNKIEEMEKKYDRQFQVVFEAIKQLMVPPAKAQKKISFIVREKRASYGKK